MTDGTPQVAQEKQADILAYLESHLPAGKFRDNAYKHALRYAAKNPTATGAVAGFAGLTGKIGRDKTPYRGKQNPLQHGRVV